jgi:maleate cis-trans isomerase
MDVRIGLIHATPIAMEPVAKAFQRLWPQATCTNLLEDALSLDLEREGIITPAIMERIFSLADYVHRTGADGILFTCSAFGDAISAAAKRMAIPVLRPNEAMFEAALARGERIGMLATFAPSVEEMEREFNAMARERGMSVRLRTLCVPEAIAALRTGDVESHNKLLAEAAIEFMSYDCVMLAHFSTARAVDNVASVLGFEPLTSPESAVRKLQKEIKQRRNADIGL